jgi:hypothetical protein
MSNWWAFLSWYENVIVWPLAIAAFVLLLKAKPTRWRVTFGVLLVLAFLPHIQIAVGDVYFDYLCRTQAGEFIYRTVDNVEGILQLRPRDGSKDYFDRMRAGDIPEDPWGHTNVEAQSPWSLIGSYSFFETLGAREVKPSKYWVGSYHESMFSLPRQGESVARFFRTEGTDLASFRKEFALKPESQYGFTWRESRGLLEGLLNIYGGEILVKELATDETLAVKRGFFRSRPQNVCPSGKDDFMVRTFLERTLHPLKAGVSGRSK